MFFPFSGAPAKWYPGLLSPSVYNVSFRQSSSNLVGMDFPPVCPFGSSEGSV